MVWEPKPLSITDLRGGHLRIRVRSSPSDGAEFGIVLGLLAKVNGRLYRVNFVASVPGSGQEHVHELMDLTLRPVNDD
jgi:hypothetical protein